METGRYRHSNTHTVAVAESVVEPAALETAGY
jgi:hypothetical protein